MKKINIESLVCTIEQGKKLDELLDRVGKYGDNLFSHCVFCPDIAGNDWYYEVVYKNEVPIIPGEIVCNAYCDAELDQLLPSGTFQHKAYKDENREVLIKHYRVGHLYYSDVAILGTNDSIMPHLGMYSSTQSKAQCLIWLIENTGYKPLNE